MFQRSTVQVLVAQWLLRKDSLSSVISLRLLECPSRAQVDANCRGRKQLTCNNNWREALLHEPMAVQLAFLQMLHYQKSCHLLAFCNPSPAILMACHALCQDYLQCICTGAILYA